MYGGSPKRLERRRYISESIYIFIYSSTRVQAKSRLMSDATPLVVQIGRPNNVFNLFLVFRSDCDLHARAHTMLSRPAYSTAGSLEKSIKPADLANRSGRVEQCEDHKNGAPTEVIRGKGNGLASTPTYPDRANYEPRLSM